MTDTNRKSQKSVSVESLLKLKRAERPNADFWDGFDRELHQRMLQTLVKKDPLYLQIIRGLSGRIAQTVAAGAAAVLVASLVLQPGFFGTDSEVGPAYSSASVGAPTASVGSSGNDADTETSTPSNRLASLARLMTTAAENVSADYRIDAISGKAMATNFTAEYGMEGLTAASYEREAYRSDSIGLALYGVATTFVY